MIEKTISTRRKCHKGHLVVKRIQFVDNRATTYYYYCERCRQRYSKIDLIGGPSESKYTKGPKKKSKESNIVVTVNKSVAKKEKKKNTKIIHDEKDGLPRITIVLAGNKLPKKCLRCNGELCNYDYHVRNKNNKMKQLIGKQCLVCDAIFYPLATYMQHEEKFVLADAYCDTKTTGNENTSVSDSIVFEGTTSDNEIVEEAGNDEVSEIGEDSIEESSISEGGLTLEEDIDMQSGSEDTFLNSQIVEVKAKEPENVTIVEVDILGKPISSLKVGTNDEMLVEDNKETKPTYDDDFGNMFDFSELEHILDL